MDSAAPAQVDSRNAVGGKTSPVAARAQFSSVHFFGGGLGGMVGAVVTAPFDLIKTRLQSDVFQKALYTAQPGVQRSGWRKLAYTFVETGHILQHTYRTEGPTALFKGLGPTLVGVIPARSINFATYGNGKQFYSQHFTKDGKENASIHLLSAATAGIVTSTATNPIWVVKTRIQLESPQQRASNTVIRSVTNQSTQTPKFTRSYSPTVAAFFHSSTPKQIHATLPPQANAVSRTRSALQDTTQCIQHIWRYEGLRGFYRGMSASYLGVTEGALQWTLYEQFKKMAANRQRRLGSSSDEGFSGKGFAAGAAKLIATVITYPHEVLRTRMRQRVPTGTQPKYTSVARTFQVVLKEEGAAALYGGMSAHLLRVVPNAVAMYLTYEMMLAAFNVKA